VLLVEGAATDAVSSDVLRAMLREIGRAVRLAA
jgi:hypothetical protein